MRVSSNVRAAFQQRSEGSPDQIFRQPLSGVAVAVLGILDGPFADFPPISHRAVGGHRFGVLAFPCDGRPARTSGIADGKSSVVLTSVGYQDVSPFFYGLDGCGLSVPLYG